MSREHPSEREAEAREQLLKAFESVCPHIVGNPFIPHFPTPPQQLLLGLHQRAKQERAFECLFGGSCGCGKSDALLMAAAQYVHHPGYAAILFRRTHTDLAQPGALMDRAMEWWLPRAVQWDGTNKIFTFPSGAKVAMAYLSKPHDHLRYQGAEYQFTGWDELTQWPNESQYQYVGLSRVRRKEGVKIPLRTLSASNPGGPGSRWVQERFVGGTDPLTGKALKPLHIYIPARITDNPFLDRETYIRGLEGLHPTVRRQLLDGDWSARDPGDYFRREWFGPLLDPETDLWPASDCIRIRWWDLAASEKPGAAFTAGVRMARHRSGVRAVEHCIAFQRTPGARDDLIIQAAQSDGRGVIVGIEVEPGSGGIAQFSALERRLKTQGFRVSGARPRANMTDAESQFVSKHPTSDSGKAARADPVASCCERGFQRRGEGLDTGSSWWGADRGKHHSCQKDGLRLFRGPWTSAFLDELENFPEGDHCDRVDALSGAWSWTEAHRVTTRMPLPVQCERNLAQIYDIDSLHPEDRERLLESRRNGRRRWMP